MKKLLFVMLVGLCATIPLPAAAESMEAQPAAAKDADNPTYNKDADNTARNVRDRGDDTLSPLDQGNSEADRTITQQIRQSVVAHDQLSMNAKNVKIITIDGKVTLRGPVKSPGEKNTIVATAKGTAGVVSVDDQLEIEAHP